ncbi:MAG: YitT family protein [Christensenellales bacterium]
MEKIDFRAEGKQLAWDYLLVTLGALLTAFAFAAFFLPHDIAPGGVTGIATVLSSVTGLNVGLLSFLINLPLFAIGWRRVGLRFAVRSFISMILLSLLIDVMPEFDLAGNMMLAAIFGGVTMGAGLGLVVRAGATTGGTDMAPRSFTVLEHVYRPMVLFAIDGIVVIIAALNFGVQAGLFALVSLYTSTKTMDSIIKGFNTAMQFLIISARQEEIIRRIHTELERGCTRLEATGTYEGRKNGTLLCVVSRMEASRLKKIVSECDPHAFVTVCDVHEALGEGFSYHQHTA